MYPVSTAYKTQIRNALRNPSYIKVAFNIIDPDASTDTTASDNGHIYYSNLDSTVFGYDITESYNTLEHNRFVLNGSNPMALPVGGDFSYQGFIGDEISNLDGYWVENPKITINFGSTYSFIGLTFDFDDFIGDYPRSMQVIAYNGVNEVFNQTVSPDKASAYVIAQTVPNCNKIEVILLRNSVPFRRCRIRSILFGIKKVFTDEHIESATWKRDMSLIDSKLPTNTFDFTIFDINREYDSENPTGVYAYMEEEQPVMFSFGYELVDGSIEWINCGNMKTTGDIKSESTSLIPRATFKTTDLLNRLNLIYYNGVYTGTPVTLYSLAETILQYSNLPLDTSGNPYWHLDDALKSYSTLAPLPKVSVKVLLQLIANAGMCELYTDRYGYIIIKPHDITINDFALTYMDIAEAPTLTKYPLLGGVDTVYTTYVADTISSQLATFDIISANTTVYNFSYDMAKTITNSVTGTVVVNSITYYAQMAVATLTGTGTITFNGYKLNKKTTAISVEFNANGDRLPITNDLITDRTHAIAYATWIGNYNNRRNEYTMDDRGFPELDCGDDIKVDTIYTDAVDVSAESIEIDYNGTISGKTKLLIK